jgi:hypothetical protein
MRIDMAGQAKRASREIWPRRAAFRATVPIRMRIGSSLRAVMGWREFRDGVGVIAYECVDTYTKCFFLLKSARARVVLGIDGQICGRASIVARGAGSELG